MHPLLNIALEAANKAGKIIIQSMDRLDRIKVEEKSKNDFVTEVDRRSEQAIIDIIHRSYPEHGIIAEESGSTNTESDFIWIIDPLDGTNNYVHGFPHFAVSIGVQIRGRLEHGLIYDPIRQEMFTASRGIGAHLNERRIRVNPLTHFDNALLATGLPAYNRDTLLDLYLTSFNVLAKEVHDVRRGGSAAKLGQSHRIGEEDET